MKKKLFDELIESLKEAGQMHRGEIRPSREFVFDAEEVWASRSELHESQSKATGAAAKALSKPARRGV